MRLSGKEDEWKLERRGQKLPLIQDGSEKRGNEDRRDKDLGDSELVMAVLTRTDRGGIVRTTEASTT